jgi:hypothetical protein
MDISSQAALLRIQNMMLLCQQLKLPVQFKVSVPLERVLPCLSCCCCALLLLLVMASTLCLTLSDFDVTALHPYACYKEFATSLILLYWLLLFTGQHRKPPASRHCCNRSNRTGSS